LSRDADIDDFSQSWAEYLSATGKFIHSTSRYGENIAGVSFDGNVTRMLETAVTLWYAEVALYNYSRPGFSPLTGHFTCLVWRDSQKLGIGYAVNENGRAIVVFNFWPPGNFAGAFERNVLRPK
jgi:glioma pathogenesis-related protein 2